MTLVKSPLSYDQLYLELAIDELAIEKELAAQPQRLQMVAEETMRLGAELDRLKQQEKVTKGTVFLIVRGKTNAAGKQPSVDECDSMVDTTQEVVDLRTQIIEAEHQYNRWYALYSNHKEKLKALQAWKDMIVSGYIGYKRPYSPGQHD